MTGTITPSSSGAAAHRGLAARAIGILTSPRATYAEIAARPQWLGAFLLVVLVCGVAATAFMATDVGQRAVLDQQLAQAEASGRHLSDAQVQMFERLLPYYKYLAFAFQLVFFGIGGVIVSALAMALFNAFLGADASFKQVFAVVAHSGIVLMVGALFALPLDYVRETLTSPTSLTVFLPMLEDNTFLAKLLGSLDLVRLWWAVNLAIGFAVLYRRRTAPIAATLLGVYAALALAYAALMMAL